MCIDRGCALIGRICSATIAWHKALPFVPVATSVNMPSAVVKDAAWNCTLNDKLFDSLTRNLSYCKLAGINVSSDDQLYILERAVSHNLFVTPERRRRCLLLCSAGLAGVLAVMPLASQATVVIDPDNTGATVVFPGLTTTPISTSQINIGFAGAPGAVEVNASTLGNGITAIAGSGLLIGRETGGDGLVRVVGDGSAGSAQATVNDGVGVRVGFGGVGTLGVSNGGLVESNEQIHFGEDTLSGTRGTSNVTVDGAGSVIRSNPKPGQFSGGRLMMPFGLADATVTVSNGGAIEAIGGDPVANEDGSIFIGSEEDRPITADVTVTGEGSRITATHFLGVRSGYGDTQVRVLDGASLEVTDAFNTSFQPEPLESIGINAIDGNARLIVDGVSGTGTASSVTAPGDIAVGAARGFVGYTAAGEPRYFFATPSAEGDQITDQQGNALFQQDGSPVLAAAQMFGSFTVLLPDQEQLDARISAPGHMEVLNGAVVSTAGDVIISPQPENPSVTLQAPFAGQPSSVTVGSGGTLQASNVIVNEFGLLTGNGGTIAGNVTLNGGSIAPGSSPGMMTIDGDLDVLGGLLQFEIGGTAPGEFDQLIVTGDILSVIDLDIEISFINGFLPSVGDTFTLFDVLGDASALNNLAGVDISVLGLDPSLEAMVSLTGSGVSVATTPAGTPPQVSAPATIPLILSSVFGLWGLRAHRRSRAVRA